MTNPWIVKKPDEVESILQYDKVEILTAILAEWIRWAPHMSEFGPDEYRIRRAIRWNLLSGFNAIPEENKNTARTVLVNLLADEGFDMVGYFKTKKVPVRLAPDDPKIVIKLLIEELYDRNQPTPDALKSNWPYLLAKGREFIAFYPHDLPYGLRKLVERGYGPATIGYETPVDAHWKRYLLGKRCVQFVLPVWLNVYPLDEIIEISEMSWIAMERTIAFKDAKKIYDKRHVDGENQLWRATSKKSIREEDWVINASLIRNCAILLIRMALYDFDSDSFNIEYPDDAVDPFCHGIDWTCLNAYAFLQDRGVFDNEKKREFWNWWLDEAEKIGQMSIDEVKHAAKYLS